MDQNPMAALQAEAARRGMNLGGSSAGIGAHAVNSQSAGNPVTQGQAPLSEEMYKSPAGIMQKAKPGETDIILKALIKRLNAHPVQGQPTQ